MTTVAASRVLTSRVFPSGSTQRAPISVANAPACTRHHARSLVAARVVSVRPPASATASDDDDTDGRSYGEPILFRFGDDGEAVVASETSGLPFPEDTRETWHDVDDAGVESAVEVLRGPDGNLLFRFTGDAQAEFEAAAANTDASAHDTPVVELTQAQKAQALLDEAAALIDQAKAIQNGDEAQIAAAAKAAAESLSDPNLEGTRIMKRTPAATSVSRNAGTSAIARVGQLGIKAVVDGIENMFSNFRRNPVAKKVQAITSPVRLPKAPKDSPWGGGGMPNGANGILPLDAAFDSFGKSDENKNDADDAGGFLFVTDASDPEAAAAEDVELEHEQWESDAARALEQGSLSSMETPVEETRELAVERYGNMGSVVAGLWRPKPVDVQIGGREFVAYITPNNLKQLPSGEYVVGDAEEETEEDGKVPGDRVGEETTIILAEKQSDGTNLFFFGLTRTVLADGSVLYKFPSGETIG